MRSIRINDHTYTTIRSNSGNLVTVINDGNTKTSLIIDSDHNVVSAVNLSDNLALDNQQIAEFNESDSIFQTNIGLILGDYATGGTDGYIYDLEGTHTMGMVPETDAGELA